MYHIYGDSLRKSCIAFDQLNSVICSYKFKTIDRSINTNGDKVSIIFSIYNFFFSSYKMVTLRIINNMKQVYLCINGYKMGKLYLFQIVTHELKPWMRVEVSIITLPQWAG